MFEQYFTQGVMSIHIREKCAVLGKVGKPGNWELQPLSSADMTKEQVADIIRYILDNGQSSIARQGQHSFVVELQTYRIVITEPPLSDVSEITIVKQILSKKIEEYKLPKTLLSQILAKNSGVIIAGAPGMGKTTVSAALAKYTSDLQRIVKTIENPRDMVLDDDIVQYTKSFSTNQELKDIILLSRPDYVLFDELRNTEDFHLFCDLRLCGTGMIGVVHATQAVDALHRFVDKTEMGLLPHIINTILFVKDGEIAQILTLKLVVKSPSGISDKNLTRPVIEILDYTSEELLYEMYTFGDQVVLNSVQMPVTQSRFDQLQQYVEQKVGLHEFIVDQKNVAIKVPDKYVALLQQDEQYTTLVEQLSSTYTFSLQAIKQKEINPSAAIAYEVKMMPTAVCFVIPEKYAENPVQILIQKKPLVTCKVGKNGIIKLRTDNQIGDQVVEALKFGWDVEIKALA